MHWYVTQHAKSPGKLKGRETRRNCWCKTAFKVNVQTQSLVGFGMGTQSYTSKGHSALCPTKS